LPITRHAEIGVLNLVEVANTWALDPLRFPVADRSTMS
jgi:hypothetical protein